ncbi:flippase [Butyrivibrio proteoclasticus]|uniref:flippase n=1 Tax=Butyrivibrio proteoclasticus TaxID=43305 RepID=UPI00047A7241|nr:flippase [Butyrivibrio proteoclasticus]
MAAEKSIIKNATFNTVYKLLNILFPLITSVYLSRVLGPTYLGRVNYAHSIMSYFLVFASLGIPTYGMREIARAGNSIERRNKVFSELFLLNFIATLICSTAFLIMIASVASIRTNLTLYICTGLTLFLNVFNIDWFYSGQEEYVYITVRSFIVKVLSIILIFTFVRKQSDYIIYALITSIATTGNYIWNVINLRGRVRFTFSKLSFGQHMKPVFVLLVTLLATDLYNQVDVTMIGTMCSDTDVGYYSNGVKIIKIVYSITTAMSATILPRLCLLYKEKNKKKYITLFWKTLHFVLLIALPCSIGLFLVAKPVVLLMFGKEFAATATVIRVLSPIIVIISFSYLIGSVVLTSTENEHCLLIATILGAVVNMLMNYLLIMKLGIVGAAISSVIGEFVVAFVHAYFGWKYVKKRVDFKYIWSVLIAIFLLCCVVIFINNYVVNTFVSLGGSVFLGGVVYLSTLLFLKNSTALYVWDMIAKKIHFSQNSN